MTPAGDTSSAPAIETHDLRKSFGPIVAVESLDLTV